MKLDGDKLLADLEDDIEMLESKNMAELSLLIQFLSNIKNAIESGNYTIKESD